MARAINIIVGVYVGVQTGNWWLLASALAGEYGGHMQRRKARRVAMEQRRAFNDGLTDRTVSIVSADNPWQIIYGEPVVGPSFTAILTSGDKDQFKHLVAVWAAHECDAISATFLAGEDVGPLDANGWVTEGRWMSTERVSVTEAVVLSKTTPTTMGHNVHSVQLLGRIGIDSLWETIPVSNLIVAGNTLQLTADAPADWEGITVYVTYEYTGAEPRLRVRHHLGADDQLADSVLMAEVPAEWTASDRGRGLCYSIFTFDLRHPEFQSGPLAPTARVRGKKVYDPRADSTQPGGSGTQLRDVPGTWAYSPNSALCTSDFIRGEYGKRARANQMTWTTVMAAANGCDQPVVVDTVSHPRYTCHGIFRTDQDPDAALDELCQSMGGTASFAGSWQVHAGVYTAPVMALTDADNAGAVEIVPSPPFSEAANGARGRFYDPERFDQVTDYPHYQNAALKAEDGGEDYWDSLDLPFTNAAWRAHNLARIFVERSRGRQLVYPAKMRALRLKPGQRITLTCGAPLNIVAGIFRITRRTHEPGGPVMLYLVQDDPSYYDEVDAPATVAPPTVTNSDPFFVAPVASLAAVTGPAGTLRDDDGTVISRVKLTYAASADVLVLSSGALQAEYRLVNEATWRRAPEAAGNSTEAPLYALQDGLAYVVRARWRNGFGVYSDWRSVGVLTDGASTITPGTGGGTSVYTAEVFLQAGSAPATPTGGSFNFSTGTLTPPAGWSATQPASSTTPTYRAAFTFSTTTPATPVTGGTWTAAVVVAQNGTPGSAGSNGTSVYTASVYLQAASAPATPTGGSFNFGTGALTPPAGWSATQPPTTTTPTYLAEYTFSTATPGGTASGGTWSTPVVDAVAGANGAPGTSVFTVEIYQQAASAPATPTGGSYTFSTDSLTPPAGWTRTQPASSTTPTWRTAYTFSTTTPAVAVPGGTWSAPAVVAQNGTPGGAGTNGTSVYTASVYLQAASLPAAPSGGSFNFGTGVLTPPAGWSASQPTTTTTPTWVAEFTFSTPTPGATVGGSTWTTPVVDAVAGANGAPGASVFTVEIYQQAASAPATPSGGSYTFSTDSLTPPAGWTRAQPTTTTTPTWRSAYTFSTTTPATPVSGGTWSTPVVAAQNGTPGGAGSDGTSVYTASVYLQAASLPATPTGGSFNFGTATLTAPAGWSVSQPTSTTTPTWVAEFTFSTATPGASVSGGTWSTPVVDAVAGTPGTTGDPGADGTSVYTAVVYRQATTAPAAPTGGSFNFTTAVLTAPASWSVTEPAVSTTTITWASRFTFTTNTPGATVSGGTWSTPEAMTPSGPVVPAPYLQDVKVVASPGTAVAGVRLKSSGATARKDTATGSTYSDIGLWYLGGTPGSYWIRFTQRTLNGGGSLSGVGGGWLALTSDRTVTLTATANVVTDAIVDYRIASDSGGTNVVTAGVIDLYCEST